MTPPVPKPSTSNRQEMRSYIQECLNAKYCMHISVYVYQNYFHYFNAALAISWPHSKVPYSQLKPNNVIGLPVGMKLQHPSQLNQQDLEVIYSLLPTIKFVGMYVLVFLTTYVCMYVIVCTTYVGESASGSHSRHSDKMQKF